MIKPRLVFAADKGFVPHLATAIASLLAANPNDRFRISVLHKDLDPATSKRLESLGESYESEISSIRVEDQMLRRLVVSGHFSTFNYYKLLIADYVDANVALYLDSDIVVRGALRSLYETDLKSDYLAAVIDPVFNWHQRLGLQSGAKYFNSGVMLMNLERWRESNLGHKVRKFVSDNPHLITYVDQCGLNAVVNGQWKELHPKYNVQGAFFELQAKQLESHFSSTEIKEALNDPVVIHYTGTFKPWHLTCEHPYKNLYWKYRRTTPFSAWLPEGITPSTIARKLTPRPLKRLMRRFRGAA